MAVGDVAEEVLRPSAARLLESMRDIGYSFESALADIVDNSISARATHIAIVNDLDAEGRPYLGILDDGWGMGEDELTEAMRHGSRSPREVRAEGDLGRFGLGMKTASFSQARRLTVVSRKAGELAARRWDLDRVIHKDEWLLQKPAGAELSVIPLVDRLTRDGTLVLWERLDRLDALGSKPDEAYAALDEMFKPARQHLALTFHRFIAPEPGDSLTPLQITINGDPLAALDPFARIMNPQSDAQEVETIRVGAQTISVQAFTLPHHKRLSNVQLEALELGDSLVQTQGLYVYRAKRLIAGGTWLGLARKAELTKLLRVRVDVPTALDTEWSIDVRKSRVQIPAIVRNRLRPLVQRMTESARRPYTYRGMRQASAPGLPLWSRVEERGALRYEVKRDHPLVAALREAAGDRGNVDSLLLAIEATLPLETLFSDVAGNPQLLRQQEVEGEELEGLLAAFVEVMAPRRDTLPASTAELILSTPGLAGHPQARAVLSRLRRIEA